MNQSQPGQANDFMYHPPSKLKRLMEWLDVESAKAELED